MKNPKLLIPVRCTTRKIYLQSAPKGRNDWHVRFTPPPVNGISRAVFRSTGTKEVAAAKRIAARIIESFWTDAGRSSEKLKLRNNHTTIGVLLDRYCERAGQRPRTVQCNMRSLRLIVRTVHAGDPNDKPTTVLTGNLIREFEKRRMLQVDKQSTSASRMLLIERARSSTASFVRQARSVVSPRKMKFYDDLQLPDLTSFRGESVEAPKRSLPRPLDMKALSQMEEAVSILAKKDPAVYVAHLLFSRLGLRNIEIVSAG